MVTLILLTALISASPADEAFFETRVRPVLSSSCVKCHGPEKQSGGLRLDTRAGFLKGAKTGPVITPDDLAQSPLLLAIRRSDDAPAMPPDKPLAAQAVADIAAWVQAGAPWPKAATAVQAQRHWAFGPIVEHRPPLAGTGKNQHPIDAFLARMQADMGVKAVAPAAKQAFIRRATFGLTGLPPTPDEIRSFLADSSANAHEKLVDSLLKRPQYGEKLGRMWMDAAHYADTAGETADIPAPQAWRYRNYIIESFNKDKPFDEFIREQIAGDLMAKDLPAGTSGARFQELVTATGYLSVARRFGFDITSDHHLTIEDTIDTVGKSILGLTLACARCHDHKYDPVSNADYYSLYGIFESSRYPFPGCEKERRPKDHVALWSDTEIKQRQAPLQQALETSLKRLALAEAELLKQAGENTTELAKGDIANGAAQAFSLTGCKAVKIQKGRQVRLTILPKNGHGADSTLVELKLQEQGGQKRTWDLTGNMLADPARNGTGFVRDDEFQNKNVWALFESSPAPRLLNLFVKDAEKTPGLQVWRGTDAVPSIFVNTNDKPIAFITVKQPARSVGLHPGPSGSVSVAFESPVDGLFEISGRVADIDPTGGDGVAWQLSVANAIAGPLMRNLAAVDEFNRAKKAFDEFSANIPLAYAMAEAVPHNAKIQVKGDPTTLGPEVPRRNLQLLGGQPVANPKSSGRAELAQWLTSKSNPLTARVIVNRVWQLHFGHGLVRSPDNFGIRGEQPSNPELLDYLAARLMAENWSIKWLNRLIMTSQAYQRANVDDESNLQKDHDNLSLWKYNRRRLTAEEIRDAMLAVSGELDPTPGGPHPFPPPAQWGYTQHSPFIDVYDHNKRSGYLMSQRIRRHPFMALFDGPDTNASTGRRDSTTVPTQALFFLNDPFVHQRSLKLASGQMQIQILADRLQSASLLLFGRPARADELQLAESFLKNYETTLPPGLSVSEKQLQSWAAWLRVMFSSNEFIYVD